MRGLIATRTAAASIAVSWLCSTSLFAQPASPVTPQAPVVATSQAATPTNRPTVPSVSSVFRDLGNDFRRLPSLATALLLAGSGTFTAVIRNHEHDLTRRAAASGGLDKVLEAGEVMGGGHVQASAAALTYAVGRLGHNPKIAAVGADLLRAQLLNAAITQGVKLSVRRVRPDGGLYSFPSGHTSASFATAAVLARHGGWKAGVPAGAVAAYVAASRLQENRHFLSDVVFGAAVGIAAGRTVTIGQGSRRFAVAPRAAPGGAGIEFTWIGAQ